VSEVAPFRIDKIAEAVAVGDKVRVMIKEIDEKGRINLSIKAADPEFAMLGALTPVPVTPLITQAPFIVVDDSVAVPLPASFHDRVMQTLSQARDSVALSLGLIERLYITNATTSDQMSVQNFLALVAPSVPQTLTRTLGRNYLLAVHKFDENVPILMLSTDSYETAYAGMLEWELHMEEDLTPLFRRTAPTRVGQPTLDSQSAAGEFVDRVVANHDARVLQNQNGDILLLWTFLDRNTIVITTNDSTLKEVITRATVGPAQ
jgi:hypothetical protein